MTNQSPAQEFARPIDVTRLPAAGAVYDISATAAERAALADRFDLLALDRLDAQVRLSRLAGGFLRLAANISAEVVQACVVTLEPVTCRVEDQFTLLYGEAVEGEAGEVTLNGVEELVEPLPDGIIDIGEAVAQQLSLALDPYPRSPGAEPTKPVADGVAVASPFAILAKLKKKS
jgi:uncharacterized metal-binding protein YceD (DUF177 family)